jgi:genome maintenance exonuclease 1
MPELSELTTEEIDGKRHYVTPSGAKLPSVTTVLGHAKKQSIIEWRNRVGEEQAQRISTRASIRGTKFHNMMEKYLENDPNLFEGVMPDMKQAFRDVQKTIDRIDNIRYIECPLYSEKLGLAGRTDCIGDFDEILSVIDFKTSLKPKKEEWIENYFEQETAYAIMYEERVGEPIEQIVTIISVDGEVEPQVFIKQKKHYVDGLLSKIKAYKEAYNVS